MKRYNRHRVTSRVEPCYSNNVQNGYKRESLSRVRMTMRNEEMKMESWKKDGNEMENVKQEMTTEQMQRT